jgi:2-polyprenyl-3-methyl-5-hydroxy-6-metoxy-1,4-benzoquinol methylase
MEIILSEISQVLKPNTACFLSDVEYRPNKYTKSAMKNNSIWRGVPNGRENISKNEVKNVNTVGWCIFYTSKMEGE